MNTIARTVKLAALTVGAAAVFTIATPASAPAQVSIGIGVAPVCPYGYYGYAPYRCAPYGYYGPEWFNGGVFLGAGPWYHGRPGWYGSVNRAYDPRFGYHGAFPEHGAYREPADHWRGFHGNDFHGVHGESAPRGYHR